MKKVTYHEMDDDFEGIAKTFIEEANKNQIPVESSTEKAKHMLKTDLRDSLPPQLFAVISKFTQVIESAQSEKSKELSKK